MRDDTVARNYAETLFELGVRSDALEEYAEAIATVAQLIEDDPKVRLFMETPRIRDEERKEVILRALGSALPKHVVHFVLVMIEKRRQRLLPEVSREYHLLLDAHMGREHVQVTVARPIDDATKNIITEKLSAALGKQAIPHIQVQPALLGGLVIRTGDTIYDGSIRRQLERMRRQLLQVRLPVGVAGAQQAMNQPDPNS
ncbi:MAG: ATP synthase F1 subunit delta [Gemmatimonadetes bacterium]|nr:ATP synthase F1 subunit delta [Gemmatimonadota bacterium]MDA1103727.1 ATP synthase F1 subunit delta [Gemmatimonadota bacterium]